jgi:hypothetical protein
MAYDNWKRKEYYHWEVNDFYDTSNKLRELAAQIPKRLSCEDFDYYLIESPEYQYLIERQNRINRALAREIRKLGEQLDFIEQLIRHRKDLVPKDALMW